MMFDAQGAVRQLQLQRRAPLRGLSCDSRRVDAHTAFLAYPGESADGRDYIAEAVDGGAGGVFWEPEKFFWQNTWAAANVAVPELRHRAGLLAAEIYGHPSRSLFVAAVTGTNGKTTITHFAAQLLCAGGKPTALIGTLGAGFLGELTPTGNTTPDAIAIHRWLTEFKRQKARAAMVEASSHGIHQRRLAGLHLSAAVLANIGRDHWEYHGGAENYRRAKARLFTDEAAACGIFNADDEICRAIAKKTLAERTLTYGRCGDDLRRLPGNNDGVLEIDGVFGRKTCALTLPGAHNADNFLAAALIAYTAGIDWECIAATAATLRLPPGRLQKVASPPGGPQVYVDYAHQPEALSAAIRALSVLRPPGRRVWVVFGCGGERDRGKRAAMGQVAAMNADVAIVTDDNPRGEDAAAIRAQITAADKTLINIAGREAAIEQAVADADDGDMVLIAGKGHETVQEIGGAKIPFSDAQIAARALRRAMGDSSAGKERA